MPCYAKWRRRPIPGNAITAARLTSSSSSPTSSACSGGGERPYRHALALSAEIDLHLAPDLLSDLVADLAAVAIAGGKVNAAVEARPAGGVGSLAQRVPAKTDVLRRTAVVLQSIGREHHLVAQCVAAGEQLENH